MIDPAAIREIQRLMDQSLPGHGCDAPPTPADERRIASLLGIVPLAPMRLRAADEEITNAQPHE